MQKTKLLLFLFIGLMLSCSHEDNKYPGDDDYSGTYKLWYVNTTNPDSICTNGTSNQQSTSSVNDLEISSNGRFKRKIYSSDSNNGCTVSKILEGQITITGSFYESPFGIVEYDNSNMVDNISIERSENGIHKSLIIQNLATASPQYKYYRTE